MSVTTQEAKLPDIDVTVICNLLCLDNHDFILLESGDKADELSRYSITDLVYSGQTRRLDNIRKRHVILESTALGEVNDCYNLTKLKCSPWSFFRWYTEKRRAIGGFDWSPFWGGLVGYVTYEMGHSTLGVSTVDGDRVSQGWPDMSFSFIKRSIVIDHAGRFCVQSLMRDHGNWDKLIVNKIVG
jgi:para-aminobenzoate synthetase